MNIDIQWNIGVDRVVKMRWASGRNFYFFMNKKVANCFLVKEDPSYNDIKEKNVPCLCLARQNFSSCLKRS